jgi:tRNA nucleotidyltransferase (CCA-adding enzyme)
VRFAVRYALTPEQKTEQAMCTLAPLMDNLARERIFEELCKLLLLVTTEELLRFAPVLTKAIPELAPMVGFDQRSPHHAYDIYTHTAHVVENTPPTLRLRWAALLHDTGKVPTFTRDETGRGHFYGHAQESAAIADTVLRRLKAPTDLREQATELISLHMTRLEPEKKVIRRWLGRLGPETMEDLLTFQKADMVSKGVSKESETAQHLHLRKLVAEVQAEASCLTLRDLAVNGNDLMALGYEGRAIGECLARLLDAVLDERLPNDREHLLETAKTMS